VVQASHCCFCWCWSVARSSSGGNSSNQVIAEAAAQRSKLVSQIMRMPMHQCAACQPLRTADAVFHINVSVPLDWLWPTSFVRRRSLSPMTDSTSSRLLTAAVRSRAHPSPARSSTGGATNSPAARRQSGAPSLAAGYPGLHELVEERIFPFMQQVVGFLGIGWVMSTSLLPKQIVQCCCFDRLWVLLLFWYYTVDVSWPPLAVPNDWHSRLTDRLDLKGTVTILLRQS